MRALSAPSCPKILKEGEAWLRLSLRALARLEMTSRIGWPGGGATSRTLALKRRMQVVACGPRPLALAKTLRRPTRQMCPRLALNISGAERRMPIQRRKNRTLHRNRPHRTPVAIRPIAMIGLITPSQAAILSPLHHLDGAAYSSWLHRPIMSFGTLGAPIATGPCRAYCRPTGAVALSPGLQSAQGLLGKFF